MQHLNFLIKPASSQCNLRCSYCFYEDETRHRSKKSFGIMSRETADCLIKRAFEATETGGTVSFAFQGGEPTIAGLPFFQRFTESVEQLCPAGVRTSFAIQTNGILLDENWASFFAEHHYLVGISMDGVKELHDLYRRDAAGKETWNRITRNLKLMEKYRVEINALCVVTGQIARHPEKAYRELKRLGFRYLQFIACLDPIGEERGSRPWSLSPAAYGGFLKKLFDCWYEDWKNGDYHSIRLFDDYIHILLGDGASTCATCGKCGAYYVVESDGSVYPCDFYALDGWRMGDLASMTIAELSDCERAEAFRRGSVRKPAECSACRWGKICGGGCRNDRYETEEGIHNYYCESFRSFLEYAVPRMERIARMESLMQRGLSFPGTV